MALRLFLLEQDPTHVPRICNILFRLCTDQNVRQWIDHSRKSWLEVNLSTEIGLNGRVYRFGEVIELLLYDSQCGMAHSNSDPDKPSQLGAMPEQIRALLRMFVLQPFPRLLRALTNIDLLIGLYRDGQLDKVPPFRS